MPIDILGLHLSPRANGNSAILLDEFLKGAREAGAGVAQFSVAGRTIPGCLECGGCEKEGDCVIQDDAMAGLYPLLATVPKLVVSTSLFFYDVPSQGKALIDRCQPLWVRRYLLGRNPDGRPDARGFLIAVGASKGENLFDPVRLCVKYFFDSLGLPKTFDSLCFRRVEAAGEINKFPQYLRQAYEAGRSFAG